MPTVEIDVTDRVSSYLNDVIKSLGSGGNLNPGQQSAVASLDPTVTATASVRIAGKDVDVTVDVEVDFGDYPEYISETVGLMQQNIELFGSKLESLRGFDSEDIIGEAFKQL